MTLYILYIDAPYNQYGCFFGIKFIYTPACLHGPDHKSKMFPVLWGLMIKY